MTKREPDDRLEEEARAKAASEDDADVVLDVPVLNVEELDLEVEELRAHISARAELAGFLSINVGVDAYVDKVKLNIKGVEAQVQLKVKLERILGSIDRALQAIEKNPQLLDPDFGRTQGAGGEGEPREREGQRELTAGAEAGEPDGEPAEEPGRDGPGPWATPAASKKAEELGLDLSTVEGTGAGGRILVRDVLLAAGG